MKRKASALHREHGSKVMPANTSPKKDLATRTKVASDSQIYQRCAKRKQRAAGPGNQKQSAGRGNTNYLNKACRMKMARKVPTVAGDRLCLQIYNSVHADRPALDDMSCSSLHCVVCRAQHSKFCYCGAGLVAKPAELNGFVAFIKSPRNPMLNYLDPQDQEDIATTFRNIGCTTAPASLRVLCIFAMISNESVMRDIGPRVKRGVDLDSLFQQRAKDGLATFRGGQFAGSITVAKLGKFLARFMATVRDELCKLLLQWSKAGKSKVKCVAIVRQILTCINSNPVKGFGPYKRKKFAEFVVLVGLGGVWGHYEQNWIKYLSDLWPFPNNSSAMLTVVFPRIKPSQRRAGVVALLRCLRHHKHFTFSGLIAQLCFWGEQKNGRIDWM